MVSSKILLPYFIISTKDMCPKQDNQEIDAVIIKQVTEYCDLLLRNLNIPLILLKKKTSRQPCINGTAYISCVYPMKYMCFTIHLRGNSKINLKSVTCRYYRSRIQISSNYIVCNILSSSTAKWHHIPCKYYKQLIFKLSFFPIKD